MSKVELMMGDCLDLMKALPDGSVDMVMCDLPYGTTQNKWDSVLPLDALWSEYARLCRGAVVLTATQPFSSSVVLSNMRQFRYEWIWQKTRVTGVLNAKRQPLRQHESVLVFSKATPPYNPQGLESCDRSTSTGVSASGSSSNYGKINQTGNGKYTQTQTGYPRSVIQIKSESKTIHPTQKPVALMEYLVRTYTNEGGTVLDNCMGSGTTGVACVQSGRNFIGMEMDQGYFEIASRRIKGAQDAIQKDVSG